MWAIMVEDAGGGTSMNLLNKNYSNSSSFLNVSHPDVEVEHDLGKYCPDCFVECVQRVVVAEDRLFSFCS